MPWNKKPFNVELTEKTIKPWIIDDDRIKKKEKPE